MSEDLNKTIKQITDILSQEELPDNIKGLLSLLSGPAGSKEESRQKSGEAPEHKDEKPVRTEGDDSIEMLRKVKKMMDRANSMNDPKVNLLSAMKPFLNNKRQQKLSNCIRILQMSSLVRLVDDSDKGSV